jgi:hypothetical protein
MAPTDESGSLRSGCGAFFKGTQINQGACDQVDFGHIIVEKLGKKLQLILSLARVQSLRVQSVSNNKYNRMAWNVLISLLYNHTAEIF